MAARLLVAVVFIPVIFIILFFLPPLALPISVAVLSAIGVHELLRSTGLVKSRRVSAYSVIFAALIPFWVYAGSPAVPAVAGLFLYILLLFLEALLGRRVDFEQLAAAFMAPVFIPLFLSALVRIAMLENGRVFLLLPFLFPFLSDAGGYFVGRKLGRRKLAPDISPNKTVEGSVGCFVGAVLGGIIYGVIVQFGFSYTVHYELLILYGLLGSLVSQIGDLSFSLIKREYKIKDFGTIFPGHGGVLDRFDSVIFAAPLLELLIYILPAIQ